MSDSDRDPKTGRFLPGNKATENKEVRFLRSQGAKQLLRDFERFGSMTLSELQELKQNDDLTAREYSLLRYWQQLMKHGDVPRLKLLFAAYGIPSDVKAVGVQEVGDLPDDSASELKAQRDVDSNGNPRISLRFVNPEHKENKGNKSAKQKTKNTQRKKTKKKSTNSKS